MGSTPIRATILRPPVDFIPGRSFHWCPMIRDARRMLSLATMLVLSLQGNGAIDDRVRLSLEALQRLKGADLQANPALGQAVKRVLEQVRGEPEFVQVVNDFALQGQEEGLREVVLAVPRSEAAVEALRLLLAAKTGSQVVPLLTGPTPRVVEVIGSLGATLDNQIAPLLLPIVVDPARPLDVRTAAVRAVARVNEGADGLLAMAVAGKITDDLRYGVGAELRGARRPSVREQAEKLFPAPLAKEGKALPPIAELVKIPGDSRRGAAVFRRADIGCINCHQVGVEGVDLGPKLTEIGGKLGKEALSEAILDPSAGISFGFEAWTIELKNGDEASGIIASETEDEIVLKIATGATSGHKKADIAKREKQKLSIMPAGLQQNMTTQDFVDLLEHLASLKKPAN